MFNLFKKNEPEKKDNLSLIAIASLLIHSLHLRGRIYQGAAVDSPLIYASCLATPLGLVGCPDHAYLSGAIVALHVARPRVALVRLTVHPSIVRR